MSWYDFIASCFDFSEPKNYEEWLEANRKDILKHVKRSIKNDKKKRVPLPHINFSVECIWWWGFGECTHYVLDYDSADILEAANYVSKIMNENNMPNRIDKTYWRIYLLENEDEN